MGQCTSDYQAPVPTPTPALPQGDATPDPTCSRGTIAKLNATASLCCKKAGAATASAQATRALLPTPQCQRAGKPVLNVTDQPGATIQGRDVSPSSTETATEAECLAACCAEEKCVAYTWWADSPAAAPAGCHHGHACCVLKAEVTAVVPGGAPPCPPNPGSHFACAASGLLGGAPRPTPAPAPAPTPVPAGCDAASVLEANRTCDTAPPPCLMVPMPSTAEVCCMWEDWAACDALSTSTPCPTVECVANVSCPAGPAAWCSSEWGNVHARGWCTGCCERFVHLAQRSVVVAAQQ